MRHRHNIKYQKVGIFVGEFNEVKGWSKIAPIIHDRTDIFWILVSKKEEDFIADNARVYNRIDQSLLAELLNCADFFILGSPVETQCLAAIEACFCDIPVVMTKVGIFADWSDEDCAMVGMFGDNLENNIDCAINGKFQPRVLMFEKCLTIENMVQSWYELISKASLSINNRLYLHHEFDNLISIKTHSILRKEFGHVRFFVNETRYFLVHRIWGRIIKEPLLKLTKKLAKKILPKKLYNYLKETAH